MDFFQTPHIQIRFLWKDPVFKYEYLEIFIYPWNANIATYPLCKQLFLFASQDYAHNMSYIPLQLLWQVSRILTPMPSGWAISLTGSASIASTTGRLLLELYQSHASLRGDYLDQIRWIFGKPPNGGGDHLRKIMLRFFGKGKALRAPISRTKAQHFFPKIGWGGGVRGRLEVFRKFIEFGPGRSPLDQCHKF